LIGIAGFEIYRILPAPDGLLDTLLAAIGLEPVALAVFEVGRFLLEEKLLQGRQVRTTADARPSLTRFRTITVIVMTIEGLVLLFEIEHRNIADLVNPTGLLIVAVLSLGLLRRLTDAFADGPEQSAEHEDVRCATGDT
jgi:hypothetical protein